MDYIKDLSEDEKAMLSKFIDEYYGAALAPATEPEQWSDDYHETEEMRKECMDRNNARNRDIYAILRTRGWVEGIEGNTEAIESTSERITENHEDVLNELLDSAAEQAKKVRE